MFPKTSDDRVPHPKINKVKGTNSPTEKLISGKFCKEHYGYFLKRVENCFGCGKSGHNIRDFRNVKVLDKGSGQVKHVVQMKLQRRTATMLSALGVSRIVLPTW